MILPPAFHQIAGGVGPFGKAEPKTSFSANFPPSQPNIQLSISNRTPA
jgi:hypothetical protein